tara:strand:- start:642 stop:908 length:267 start_codon:yes stop_codon:yes gene_type:complete
MNREQAERTMKTPLIFFAEEAKRRGYTIKVVGDYSFKKSRRIDSPRIRFTKTLPDGITVTEYHPRTKKSKEIDIKAEVDHGDTIWLFK